MVLSASNRNRGNVAHVQLNINGQIIVPSSTVRSLGVCIDSYFTLSSHINLVVRTCNYHLRNLWRIRKFITIGTCHHAVRALVTSRLDYCNSLFSVLSARNKKKLESIQNRSARLIFAVSRTTHTHTTPLLKDLHWLPFQKRIWFKLCLYIYKILHQSAPTYLQNLISVYTPTRTLRSASDKSLLTIPRSSLSIGDKRFNVSAAKFWNNLPLKIREHPTLAVFKKHLKTYLFSL